jgi:hypothetical protein
MIPCARAAEVGAKAKSCLFSALPEREATLISFGIKNSTESHSVFGLPVKRRFFKRPARLPRLGSCISLREQLFCQIQNVFQRAPLLLLQQFLKP